MKEQIASLTSEQAQEALSLFYDMLPNELWEGPKPSSMDIKIWAEDLQEEAPPEIQPFLTTLFNKPDWDNRGEIAKILLDKFAEYQLLLPYIEKAVARAAEAHMAPVPVIIGALVVVLAVIPKEIKTEKVHIKFGHLEEAAKFIDKLTEFVNVLPAKLRK